MDCSLCVATHILQSMSYSGMRFVDKLHADYNPCLTPVRFVDKLHADYNLCLTKHHTGVRHGL
jgi:hypothetical protein